MVPKALIMTFPEEEKKEHSDEEEAGETGTAQTELHDALLPEMDDLLPRDTAVSE